MSASLQRYTIAGCDDYGFYTCTAANGHQLLFGIQLPELVVVDFDRDGILTEVAVRPLRTTTTDPYDDEVARELEEVKRELGWRPSAIHVAEFFLPDRWIGIRRLPDHYQELTDHPERFSEPQRAELEDDIGHWMARGDFVLYWNEDYYLDRDGEVVSS